MPRRPRVFLIGVLLLAGCGKAQPPGPAPDAGTPQAGPTKPADLIVGKWEPVGEAKPNQLLLPIEFTKDGKVDLILFQGTYQFTDPDVVVVTTPLGPGREERVTVRVAVTADELELDPLDGPKKGEKTKYRRVAEFSEEYRTPAKGGTGSGKTAPAKLKDATTLKGQEGPVNAVCFSPDGELVAGGGDDKVVRVWKRATGEVVATLSGHKEAVKGLAWSPRGDLLASAGGGVKLWDTKGWKEVPTKLDYRGKYIRFSPDGTRLLAGLQEWDAVADTEVRVVAGDLRNLRSLAVSPDGRHVATMDDFGTAKVIEVGSGKVAFSRKHGLGGGVAFSRDGKTLALGWDQLQLVPWVEGNGAAGRKLSTRRTPVDQIEFLGDRHVAAAVDDRVLVFDVTKEEPVAEAGGHAARIESVAVSDDGKWLATGGNDSLVKVWDISGYGTARSKAALPTTPAAKQPADTTGPLTPPKTPDTPPARTPEPKTGGFDPKDMKTPDLPPVKDPAPPATLPTFDPVKSEKPLVLKGELGRVVAVAFSPDGGKVAALVYDLSRSRSTPVTCKAEVTVWNLITGQADHRHTFDVPFTATFGTSLLAYCPDGSRVAVACGAGVKVLDLKTGLVERDYTGHGQPLAACYSPNGGRLVVAVDEVAFGGNKHSVRMREWDTATGKEAAGGVLKGEAGGFGPAAFTPDLSVVGVAVEESRVETGGKGDTPAATKWTWRLGLYDRATGEVKRSMSLPVDNWLGPDSVLFFDPTGRQLALAYRDGVIVCDPERGTTRRLLAGGGTDVRPSVEGNRLAVVEQKRVRVVDATSGKDTLILPVAESPAWRTGNEWELTAPTTRSAFSPDGRYFAVASGVTVQVWERKDGATRAVPKVAPIKAVPSPAGVPGDDKTPPEKLPGLGFPSPDTKKVGEVPGSGSPDTKKGDAVTPPLPAPKEVKRPNLHGEMQTLKQVIETLHTFNGRMPDAAEIRAELGQSAQKTLALVTAGTIVLTGTKDAKGVWAYEAGAGKDGGYVIAAGVVQRVTAVEARNLIPDAKE